MQRLTRSISSLLLALALTLSLSACDSGGSNEEETPAVEDGRVEVSFAGDVEASFDGYAYFFEGTDPETNETFFAILLSKTNTQTTEQEHQWIVIGRTSGRPEAGQYAFTDLEQDSDLASGDFGAFISSAVGDGSVLNFYFSRSGTLTIDHSSDDRVAGSFSIDAAGFEYTEGSTNAEEVSITVEGAFDANPTDSAAWLDGLE